MAGVGVEKRPGLPPNNSNDTPKVGCIIRRQAVIMSCRESNNFPGPNKGVISFNSGSSTYLVIRTSLNEVEVYLET